MAEVVEEDAQALSGLVTKLEEVGEGAYGAPARIQQTWTAAHEHPHGHSEAQDKCVPPTLPLRD